MAIVVDDDATLVRAVAEGSEAALATLYDRHAATIFRVGLAIGHDPDTAEEVVQETFLALWNRAEVFDPAIAGLGTWLASIARNRALDRVRWSARRVPATAFSSIVGDRPDQAATVEWLATSGEVLSAGMPEPGPEASVDARERAASVVSALDRLTARERTAIVLAYRDGLSQSEIATRLDWPLGTVKTTTRRALRRLRAALGEGTIEPEVDDVAEAAARVCCLGASGAA